MSKYLQDNFLETKNYLTNFFYHLDKEYQKNQFAKRSNYGNFPHYDISTQVSANIFGFPTTDGYLETQKLRDNREVDNTIKSMLENILEKDENSILVDLGINNGDRTYKILNSINKEKLEKIKTIIGVDSNQISLSKSFFKLDSLNSDYLPLNKDINQIPKFLDNYRNELKKTNKFETPKFIFLGLENILLNTSFLGFETSGVIDYIDSLLENNDEIIFDFHNKYDKVKYVGGVESQFKEFFENSHLSKVVGGQLDSRILSDENDIYSDIKQIYIKNIKYKVKFNEYKFNFKPWVKKFYNPKSKKRDEIQIQESEIVIAKSSSQNKKNIFEFLFDSLSRDLVATTKDNIKIIDSKTIYHFIKQENINSSYKNSYDISFGASDNKQRKIIFGEYPSHYTKYLTKNSNTHFLLDPYYEFFPTGKKIIENRIKNPNQQYNRNMYNLIDELGYSLWDKLVKETKEFYGE